MPDFAAGASRLRRREFLAAAAAAALLPAGAHALSMEDRPDLAALFAEQGTPGAFALFDVAEDRIVTVGGQRASRRYPPASTFKIPNSLIAIETGAVRDEREVFVHDGKPRFLKDWERDMTMAEAFRVSNVPVYQEIARRIGIARMTEYLARLDYGNRNPGTVVDRFWLDGPLEISAVGQASFLARLARRALPISQEAQGFVRRIAHLERVGEADLYGKTGALFEAKLGWWVGWVERAGRIHSFALNIDLAAQGDLAKRIPLGKALLARLGVL